MNREQWKMKQKPVRTEVGVTTEKSAKYMFNDCIEISKAFISTFSKRLYLLRQYCQWVSFFVSSFPAASSCPQCLCAVLLQLLVWHLVKQISQGTLLAPKKFLFTGLYLIRFCFFRLLSSFSSPTIVFQNYRQILMTRRYYSTIDDFWGWIKISVITFGWS